MGWKPAFNFQLRDDEVVFGNVVLNSSVQGKVSGNLLKYRDGEELTEEFRELLKQHMYSADEFMHLDSDFKQVKIDIKYFNSIFNKYDREIFKRFRNRLTCSLNYIAGSKTWLDCYVHEKGVAAEMYRQLLDAKYPFDPVHKREYDERYAIVIEENEPGQVLDKMCVETFKEDVLRGYPHAEMKFVENLVHSGICTRKQAIGRAKLLKASLVAQLNATSFSDDGTYYKDGEEVTEEELERVEGEIIEDIQELTLTYELMRKLYNNVFEEHHIDSKDQRIFEMFDLFKEMAEAAGSPIDVSIDYTFGHTDPKDVCLRQSHLKHILTNLDFRDLISLIDISGITITPARTPGLWKHLLQCNDL